MSSFTWMDIEGLLRNNPDIIDIIAVEGNTVILRVDPHQMEEHDLYCFICDSYGRITNDEEFDYSDVVETVTEGICSWDKSIDRHYHTKVRVFPYEDHERVLINKIDLTKHSKNRKGLYARIRALFRSKNIKEYGDNVIFIDPKKMLPADGMHWPYCCMCDKDADKSLGNEWVDNDRKRRTIHMLVSGWDYSTDTIECHRIDTEQLLSIEDVAQQPMDRPDILYSGNRQTKKKVRH